MKQWIPVTYRHATTTRNETGYRREKRKALVRAPSDHNQQTRSLNASEQKLHNRSAGLVVLTSQGGVIARVWSRGAPKRRKLPRPGEMRADRSMVRLACANFTRPAPKEIQSIDPCLHSFALNREPANLRGLAARRAAMSPSSAVEYNNTGSRTSRPSKVSQAGRLMHAETQSHPVRIER
jgi:hypothetical protein